MHNGEADLLGLHAEVTTPILSEAGSDSSSRSVSGATTQSHKLPGNTTVDLPVLLNIEDNKMPTILPTIEPQAEAPVRFTGLAHTNPFPRTTNLRRVTKLKIGQEIKDLRSRKTKVADKILSKTPETQGKIIAYQYNYGTNNFDIYNPYAYNIPFLHELRMDAVMAALHETIPDPANAVYIQRTKLTFYILILPLVIYLSYVKFPILSDSNIPFKVKITQAMLYTMYITMMCLMLMVQYVYNKNKYFDWMHTRGKVMKAVLGELNGLLYDKKEVVWTAGKYGLFFYGTLRKRRLYLRGRSESEALDDTVDKPPEPAHLTAVN
jgi:hypothetical protein